MSDSIINTRNTALSTKVISASAVSILVYLFIPAVNLGGKAFGVATGSGYLTGAALTGAAGWLMLAAFAAAAAARFVPTLQRYRGPADIAALVLLVVTILYAVFGSPVAQAMSQVSQAQNQFGTFAGSGGRPPMPDMVSLSITPNIGLAFFIAAPVLLLFGRLREGKS